jgi:predicted helicase
LVEFIVRSVQRRLESLSPAECLHIIDPTCGYGGFLIEAGRHIGAGRVTGFEIDGPTCDVARLLTARETPDRQPTLMLANPLLAGDSLRAAILGTPEEPLVPIIIGNPPWSNFGQQNRGPWIDRLLSDYRTGLNERKSNLADDAIKFLRWAQYWVEQAGAGIVAFVTPNTWLAGLTHRRMRQSLLETFDELFVLDLHGAAGDASDENVFGVRSGVAVVLLVRHVHSRSQLPAMCFAQCNTSSLRGSRTEKFAAISAHSFDTLSLTSIHPAAPDWSLAVPPQRGRSIANTADYGAYWPLNRIFREYTSGVQTKHDAIFVGFTRDELAQRVQAWLANQLDPPPFDSACIQPYLLAPFDRRYVYYDPRLIGRARQRVMRHMLQPNLGLVFMRQSTNRGQYDHFLAVDCLVSDRVFYSRHGAPFLAPLWTYKAPTSGWGELGSGFGVQGSGVEANFDPGFVEAVARAIGENPLPRELFQYLYAVAHWPGYRERFGEELRRGFPRFPQPVDGDGFRGLTGLGGQLIALHAGSRCLEFPAASLSLAAEDGEAFRIGGYDVLRRWAKPRLLRGLSADDERELARLAWIGRETRRLMREIENQSPDQWSG